MSRYSKTPTAIRAALAAEPAYSEAELADMGMIPDYARGDLLHVLSEHGLTPGEFARHAGLSPRLVVGFCEGRTVPLGDLRRIEVAYQALMAM